MSKKKTVPIGGVTSDMKADWQYRLDIGQTYEKIAADSINQRTRKPYTTRTIHKYTSSLSSNTKLPKLPDSLYLPSREYNVVNSQKKFSIVDKLFTPEKFIPSPMYTDGHPWHTLRPDMRRRAMDKISIALIHNWYDTPDEADMFDWDEQIQKAAFTAGNTAAKAAGESNEVSYQACIAVTLAVTHIVSKYICLDFKIRKRNQNFRKAATKRFYENQGEELWNKINTPGFKFLSQMGNKDWQESPYSIVAYLAYIQALCYTCNTQDSKDSPDTYSNLPLDRADMEMVERFSATCVNGSLNPNELLNNSLLGVFCANVAMKEEAANWIMIYQGEDSVEKTTP